MQILPLFIVLLFPFSAWAGEKALGATYPIAEPDFLMALEERGRQIDWAALFEPKKMLARARAFTPPDLKPLPQAVKGETYYTDPTYTLEYDLPSPDGRIVYPKGYRVNVLDYLQIPEILVVIDATDKRQLAWFKTSPYAKDDRTRLLICRGEWWRAAKELKRSVFYLDANLASRLGLKAVPSVAFQKGNLMEVTTFELDKLER
jgi:conjugal transfer pilus assembly protein TraW